MDLPSPPIPADLADRLRAVTAPDAVVESRAGLTVYECDALTVARQPPRLVVHPSSTRETAAVLAILHECGVPFLPRGAGTGLAGGTIPLATPVVVSVSRLRDVTVDLRNRRATVGAGVVNLSVTKAVEADGFLYAPDPSSQGACTIGGNVATNSGGPHTLKYGVTADHVLGLTLVLPDGRVIELENDPDAPGYDLTGLIVGHEGTFGVVTEVAVRLIRGAPGVRTLLAIFDAVEDASLAVSGIIARGIVPAAVEMIDNPILAALNTAFGMDFPEDAAAVVLIELDGLEDGLDRQADHVDQVCRENRAREVRRARDDAERTRLWAARKKAFGAIGRLAPNFLTQDGVVPRTKLPEVLGRIRAISEEIGVRCVNIFHAGDGNLHPCLLYDERDPDSVRRALDASARILSVCLELGGSLTGEHGIGVEKIALMDRLFSEDDLEVMRRVRAVFDPDRRSNPGKLLPERGGVCVEILPRKQAAS